MKKYAVVLLAAVGFLVGCSPVQVRKEARHVRVSDSLPLNAQSCQFVAKIKACASGDDVHKAIQNAGYKLRNQAHEKGGNFVLSSEQKPEVAPVLVPFFFPNVAGVTLFYMQHFGFIASVKGKLYHCQNSGGPNTM